MDTQGRIDRLLKRVKDRGLDTPSSSIYAEGVKGKLRQARYCLEILRSLEHVEETTGVWVGPTGPAAQDLLTVSERVNLYCDAFWDFLRSSLDILGQLINELRSLGIGEREVDFKKVADMMASTAPGSQLERAIAGLRKSLALGQLEDYRHCSTHRRPIYIMTSTTKIAITGTPGYYFGSSGPETINVERHLCTNPWDTVPKLDHGKRPIAKYCESLLQSIEKRIDTIVNRLP